MSQPTSQNQYIAPFQAGQPRTLIEAAEANHLIDLLNSIISAKILPPGGKLLLTRANCILDISGSIESYLQNNTDLLTSLLRELIEKEIEKIIEEKLVNASFTLTCDESGTGGTITLTVS
jgi:hypothetical protein